MARARNIKPGFFRNADLVEMSFETRLLFIGLWTIADRAGRMEDRPKQIKMELFPADNIDVELILEQLAAIGMIKRYSYGGKRYLHVVNFDKHQNPHRDEKQSTIPDEDGHIAGTKQEITDNSASTVQAQCKHSANPADSLIPDSLIPDSLIPDSLIPELKPNVPTVHSRNASLYDLPNPVVETKEKIKRPERLPCPVKKIIDIYHETLPVLPAVAVLTETRRGNAKARWEQVIENDEIKTVNEGIEFFSNFFEHVGKSKFLTGQINGRQGGRPFKADFEWLMKPNNFAKILEGKYHQ